MSHTRAKWAGEHVVAKHSCRVPTAATADSRRLSAEKAEN